MKKEELLEIGLTEEKADKVFAMNGRDIEKHKAALETAKADLEAAKKTIADREADLEGLKKTAGDAEASKKQLEELQAKYAAETKAHREELDARDYADAVSAAVAELKFSSKGAKAAFVAGLKEKKLAIKDGKLDGFSKYLEEAKKADPDSFQPEENTGGMRVDFGAPLGGGKTPMTKAEIFKIKDPTDRQNAIAANIGIFRKDE